MEQVVETPSQDPAGIGIMVLIGAFHLPHNTRTAVKDQLKIQILGSAPLRSIAAEEILEQVQKLIIHY